MDIYDPDDFEEIEAIIASSWTVKRLADALHVSPRQAHRIALRLPHVRVGRRLRVPDLVARDFLRGCVRKPEGAIGG